MRLQRRLYGTLTVCFLIFINCFFLCPIVKNARKKKLEFKAKVLS